MPVRAQRLALLLLCSLSVASAQPRLAKFSIASPGEQRASRAFATAAANSPLALTAFLVSMPKGADLHMHLTGAVYAESFIRQAASDTLCYSPEKRSLFKPSATTRSLPPQPVCGERNRRGEDALKDQKLYDTLVDDFSMRSFVPFAGTSGHDQFFATFSRFLGIDPQKHLGQWLDEISRRAAAQNEQYLEVMHTPDFAAVAKLGYEVGWNGNPAETRSSLL